MVKYLPTTANIMTSETGNCSTCGAELCPEHVFCPKCGTSLGISEKQIESPDLRKPTPREMYNIKNLALTNNLRLVITMVYLTALVSFYTIFISVIFDNFFGFYLSIANSLLLSIVFLKLVLYSVWARRLTLLVFTINSILFFVFDFAALTFVFLFFTLISWYLLYIDSNQQNYLSEIGKGTLEGLISNISVLDNFYWNGTLK